MSEQSKIAWTDATWNPWIGCTKVSEACRFCYAEISTPTRVARSKGVELWGGKNRQRASEATFNAPLRWNKKPWVCDECGTAKEVTGEVTLKPTSYCAKCDAFGTFHRRRVFSLSLGDWLDPDVPIEWLAEMLDVVRRCPELDFQLLTKRPELWRERVELAHDWFAESRTNLTLNPTQEMIYSWLFRHDHPQWNKHHPPANIWIGTTVENQEYADKRIPELFKIPAVCRFVSYEPALGAVDFGFQGEDALECIGCEWRGREGDCTFRESGGDTIFVCPACCEDCAHVPHDELCWSRGISWIIVGGESGPKARPFNIEWARSTVRQCREAGVACFVKQLGARPIQTELDPLPDNQIGDDGTAHWWTLDYIKDKKGGDIAEFPEDLRVREWPKMEGKTGALKLAEYWRAKALDLAARFPGTGGDVAKVAYDECAKDLEDLVRADDAALCASTTSKKN